MGKIIPSPQPLGCCLLLILLIFSFSFNTFALTDEESKFLIRRQLHTLNENGHDLSDDYDLKINVPFTFPNVRLRKAFIALQAWKMAIYSDPNNAMENWVGPNVCDYKGVFCSPLWTMRR